MICAYQACLKRVDGITMTKGVCPQCKAIQGSHWLSRNSLDLRSSIAIDCFQQLWANVAGRATVLLLGPCSWKRLLLTLQSQLCSNPLKQPTKDLIDAFIHRRIVPVSLCLLQHPLLSTH